MADPIDCFTSVSDKELVEIIRQFESGEAQLLVSFGLRDDAGRPDWVTRFEEVVLHQAGAEIKRRRRSAG